MSRRRTYEWEDGRSRSVPAQTVGTIIDRIERREGSCPPGRLVEVATPDDSPLHDLFEWNDSVAASRYRISQARQVINTVRVVRAEDGQKRKRIAFVAPIVRVDGSDIGGYVSTDRMQTNALLRGRVLRDALSHLTGLQRRYQELRELESVWQALDTVRDDLGESVAV